MNDQKILEAIEKELKKKYSIVLSDDAKEILSSIKAELPPTDLVKVEENQKSQYVIDDPDFAEGYDDIIQTLEWCLKKIREVKMTVKELMIF